MDLNKTFIKLGAQLVLLAKESDDELLVLDPAIHAFYSKLKDGNRFGSRKLTFSPIFGKRWSNFKNT